MTKIKPKRAPRTKPNYFVGEIPPSEAGWKFFDAFHTPDGHPWQIYTRPSYTKWTGVKVFSLVKTAHKAAYWMAWNGARVARARDTQIMASGRPDLLYAVIKVLATCRKLLEKDLDYVEPAKRIKVE